MSYLTISTFRKYITMTNASHYQSPLRLNPQRAKAQAQLHEANEGDAQVPSPRKSLQPKVTIEYQAPHWFIATKAPSGKWEALCSATKRVTTMNAFGDIMHTRPAIESFKSYQEAYEYVVTKMPSCRLVKRSPFFSSMGNLLNVFQ